MGNFVVDSFTDTDGTALGSHTGETGATWTEVIVQSGDPVITDANRLRTASGNTHIWTASGTPSGADYDVIGGIVQRTQEASNNLGVVGRLTGTGGTTTSYLARYIGATTGWQLYRIVSGSATQLGTTQSQTLTADQRYELKLSMSGTTIKLYVDSVEKISVTDNNVTDAGLAGVRGAGAISNTTGLHMDDFTATEAGGGTTYQGEATASWAMTTTAAATGTFPRTVTADMALTSTAIGGLVVQGEATAEWAFTDTAAAIKAVFGEVTDSLVLTSTAAGRVDFSATITAGLGLAMVLGTVAEYLANVTDSVTITTAQSGATGASYTLFATPITIQFRVTPRSH